MKAKLAALHSLMQHMSSQATNHLKSSKKPIVSVDIIHHDEQPENDMLAKPITDSMDSNREEHELSIAGDDMDGRKAMLKRFGR